MVILGGNAIIKEFERSLINIFWETYLNFMSFGEFDFEKQLSKYAIKELEDSHSKAKLLSSLNRGEVMPLTFQRKLVPANEISCYEIVEHLSSAALGKQMCISIIN